MIGQVVLADMHSRQAVNGEWNGDTTEVRGVWRVVVVVRTQADADKNGGAKDSPGTVE